MKVRANVTISVSEELKAKMDTYSEVSWSRICQNAISQYIAQRENPNPIIELDIKNPKLIKNTWAKGYPTLSFGLKISNKMNTKIIVDRILSSARFVTRDGKYLSIGHASDLGRKTVSPNSSESGQLVFFLYKERIEELEGKFDSTFTCEVSCVVYVDGFRNPHNQTNPVEIPIDHWSQLVTEALKKPHQDVHMI